MENLFNQPAYGKIKKRLDRLNVSHTPLWGKMNVTQMLQHCTRTFGFALATKPAPRHWLGLMAGWMFKKSLYDDKPWKKGLPTAPHLRVTDTGNFEEEKQLLSNTIDEFYNRGPEKAGMFTHPVFGNFTKEQWGMMCYKHLDHHFRQFGV